LRREALLTSLDEKVHLIRQTGIDSVEVLTFTDDLRQMTAHEFMEQVLRDRLNVAVLLTGYDNRFGHNREEGFEDYVRYGRQLGIEVLQLPAEGEVSSSRIRSLLNDGQVDEAAALLGHPYQLTGSVMHGEHIGTRLGFPTANLVPVCTQQIVPAAGVYAVRVLLEGDNVEHPSMMNIGRRPTFNGHETTLEVHVLHLDANLYGRTMTVRFVQRLREERRFDSEEALKAQLQKDLIQTEKIIR
jgi:riboflavin kinase/FMN adenylyltransferase